MNATHDNVDIAIGRDNIELLAIEGATLEKQWLALLQQRAHCTPEEYQSLTLRIEQIARDVDENVRRTRESWEGYERLILSLNKTI